MFLMGESYRIQWSFKVSQGMLNEFGPQEVIDTPIAELGLQELLLEQL